MSKRFPPARYSLPLVVNPTGSRCIAVQVPDDPYHVAAFRGQLEALAHARSWANDEDHTALAVAAVWREVVNNTEFCGMEFRQDDCHLYSIQNGIETLIYDGKTCIDHLISEGYLSPSVPNDTIGPKPAGECLLYSFDLQVYEETYIPQLVSAGDTLEFSNLAGGTTDVLGLDVFWYCPTGAAYLLGECTGPRGPAVTGDPLQTASHCSLIVRIGSTYYDVIGAGTFVVPSGVSKQPCAILLNISHGLGITATGNVRGVLTWCRNEQWCYSFDFTASNGGWEATKDSNNEGGATWVDGQGWQSVYNTNRQTQHINLLRNFDDTGLTYLAAEYDLIINGETYKYHAVNVTRNGVSQYAAGIPAVNGNNLYSHDFTSEVNADQIVWEMRQLAGITEYSYLRSVEVHGTGTNPFGNDNCEAG